MPFHKDLTGDEAVHQIMYVQTSDPGAVGAKKFWLDTTGGASLETGAILKQRNDANGAWTTRADLSSLGSSAFGTVAVSGQSDVVADAAADTLTLAAGSGITITTNAGTDTVTIASSSAGYDPVEGWYTRELYDWGTVNGGDASPSSGLARESIVGNSNNARANYRTYQTAASTGATCGIYSGNAQTTRDYLPRCVTIIEFPSVADIRYFFGLTTSNPSGSDSCPNNSALFRFSTNVPDTNWQCLSRDGSTTETTDSGVAVAINTRYELKVVESATDVKFYINGTLVATHSTNIPTSTTSVGVTGRLEARTGSAKSLYHSRTILADRY